MDTLRAGIRTTFQCAERKLFGKIEVRSMCFIDKKRCVVAVTDFCDRLQITAKTVVRRADQKYGFRIRRFREGFFDRLRRYAAHICHFVLYSGIT